jgi:RNA polymerase sigma-70 factor (family 1)
MDNAQNNEMLQPGFSNEALFEQLYTEYYLSIYQFARAMVLNRQDAEDIATDTFVKFWRSKEDFTNLSDIRGFLYTTAKNACLDLLRFSKMKKIKQQELIAILHSESENEFLLSEMKTLHLRQVHKEIEKLPAKTKAVFKMAYLQGLKNAEIAAYLDISEKTVRNIKAEALKTLRQVVHPSILLLYICLAFEHSHMGWI